MLRDEQALEVRRHRVIERDTRKRGRSRMPVDIPEQDQELYTDLRKLRKQLADNQGVPPYVIFHDATLAAISMLRPGDIDSLLDIPGIGKHKLDHYGAQVIEVVRDHIMSL